MKLATPSTDEIKSAWIYTSTHTHMPPWRAQRQFTWFTEYYRVQCLAKRWTTDIRLPGRTVISPHCQVQTRSTYHSSCPKSTRKSVCVSKAAAALHFSNTDVALRDVSYDEMRSKSTKFAVRNSKTRNPHLAADTQLDKKCSVFTEPKQSLPCSHRPTTAA